MYLGNVVDVMQMAYQKTNQTKKTLANGTSFADTLQNAEGIDTSKVDAYTEQLRSKYGNVMIMNVGSDQTGA